MKKTKIILLVYIMMSVLFISVAYSSFNTNLYINGVGVIRAQADVRINGITNIQYVDEAIENFNPNYNVDRLNVSVNLPTEESSISYNVLIKNYSDAVYISSIELESEVNENVVIEFSDGNDIYNIPNDDMPFSLSSNEQKNYTLTISNKNGTTNNNVIVSLKFNYIYDIVTAPIIELSNDENSVQLLSAGSSTFGVSHYEYYIQSVFSNPTEQTTATGQINSSLNLADINYKKYYVWFRTVSNKGKKSEWSNYVLINRVVTLTYVTNGGSACAEKEVLKGNNWGNLCDSEKEGYILEGWYMDNETFNNILNSTTIALSDTTVYAHWIDISNH